MKKKQNIYQITLSYDQDIDAHLEDKFPKLGSRRILSKALDARGANKGKKPKYHYTVEILDGENIQNQIQFPNLKDKFKHPPLIIGAGPAGLFAAIRFAEYGIPCTILERGPKAEERMRDIAKFWRYGKLNEDSNVCYGEGGAGLFSDGKLITRIKSPYISYVMNKLVDFGAPKEVAYLSNPHLGSNKIRQIIPKLSDYLKSKGTVIHYNAKVEEFIFDHTKKKATGVLTSNGQKFQSDQLILAFGHSAHELFYRLNDSGVAMKAKDFALGVRIEHPRTEINSLQYGNFSNDPKLETAKYRLSYQDQESSKGIYSFCMCPGGYVLSSGTEKNGLVTNGMSNFTRKSPWSNSALVVTVDSEKDLLIKKKGELSPSKDEKLFAGLNFQRKIEKKAFELSRNLANGIQLPAVNAREFFENKTSSRDLNKTSCPSGIFKADMSEVFPKFIINSLRKSLGYFDSHPKGFLSSKALLIAPETRTSSPLTILRDENGKSVSHDGLYPCGEGAGYAGGITSPAVDGIKITEHILSQFSLEK